MGVTVRWHVRPNALGGIEIDVATELSSGAISSILESVPGIAHVLRSPVADAMVNLSRAAAGVGPFHIQDARELIRYAVRRGLIGSDEGDRVTAEVEGAAAVKAEKAATRKAVREERKRIAGRATGPHAHAAHAKPAQRHPAPKKKPAPRASRRAAKRPAKHATKGKRGR
jgi:hypothetical protein